MKGKSWVAFLDPFKQMAHGEDQCKTMQDIKNLDIINIISTQRSTKVISLECLTNRTTKEVFMSKLKGTWKTGTKTCTFRLLRERDLFILKVSNWETKANSRTAWNYILRKARAYLGCRAIEKEDSVHLFLGVWEWVSIFLKINLNIWSYVWFTSPVNHLLNTKRSLWNIMHIVLSYFN